MHIRLGSATLSQVAFPVESNPNFPWEKSHWNDTVVKSLGFFFLRRKKKRVRLAELCFTLAAGDNDGCSTSSSAVKFRVTSSGYDHSSRRCSAIQSYVNDENKFTQRGVIDCKGLP